MRQGYDGDAALRLMQPTLQTLWELQADFGYEVDAGTKLTIDQAVAAGRVRPAARRGNRPAMGGRGSGDGRGARPPAAAAGRQSARARRSEDREQPPERWSCRPCASKR